jgi:hypothetical protein
MAEVAFCRFELIVELCRLQREDDGEGGHENSDSGSDEDSTGSAPQSSARPSPSPSSRHPAKRSAAERSAPSTSSAPARTLLSNKSSNRVPKKAPKAATAKAAKAKGKLVDDGSNVIELDHPTKKRRHRGESSVIWQYFGVRRPSSSGGACSLPLVTSGEDCLRIARRLGKDHTPVSLVPVSALTPFFGGRPPLWLNWSLLPQGCGRGIENEQLQGSPTQVCRPPTLP